MGILNLTPDSFFDGGRFDAPASAEAQAAAMAAAGADVIDLGAESSRPGSAPVSAAEELKRLLPALERMRPGCPLPLSVDTTKPEVARAALAAGADWLNDIWGLQGDPEMAVVAAGHAGRVVIMHNQRGTDYPGGVVDGILRFFERSLSIAERAGIAADRLILDPGIGFGKTAQQSLEVMRNLGAFRRLGLPLLLGASRKSFIGQVLDLPAAERLEGSLATTVAAVAAGFDIVRVHDVGPHVRVARMADALYRPIHG